MTETTIQDALRQRIDNELAADGQRLRGNDIVQEFSEGPLMLPCSPRVVERDIDLPTRARKLGIIIEESTQANDSQEPKAMRNGLRA